MKPHKGSPDDRTENSNINGPGIDNDVRVGNKLVVRHRKDGKTRILHLNVQFFPRTNYHPKNEIIRQLLNTHQIDIAMFSEMNTQWHNLPAKDRLEFHTHK